MLFKARRDKRKAEQNPELVDESTQASCVEPSPPPVATNLDDSDAATLDAPEAAADEEPKSPPPIEPPVIESDNEEPNGETREERSSEPEPIADDPNRASQDVDSTQAPDGELIDSRFTELRNEIETLQRDLSLTREAQSKVVTTTSSIAESQKLAAEQLRRLGTKVDRVTSAVADSRFRQLVEGLLLYYDLLAGLAENAGASTSDAKPFETLKRQLLPLLSRSDVSVIPIDGEVDFEVHRPVDTVVANNEDENQKIVSVLRLGFRCGDEVIRPAEVVVAVLGDSDKPEGKEDSSQVDEEPASPEPGETEQEAPPTDV